MKNCPKLALNPLISADGATGGELKTLSDKSGIPSESES